MTMRLKSKDHIPALRKKAREMKKQWERAYAYAYQVAQDAVKRAEYIHFRSPVRKEYERAVKALEKALRQ